MTKLHTFPLGSIGITIWGSIAGQIGRTHVPTHTTAIASKVSDSRNYLASNLGMTVKRDLEGAMLVAVTDLRSSSPLGGVNVTFMNYQNRPLLSLITGDDGLARDVLGCPALLRRG